jgi:hypothetical protein
VTPAWRYQRTFIHGDLAEINPFSHRMPGPAKVIVENGQVCEGMQESFERANPDGLGLTPPSRLGAIFRDAGRDAKPRRTAAVPAKFDGEKITKPPIEEIVVDVLDSAEHYTPITSITKKESRPLDDFEEAQYLPYREAA